MPSYIVNGNITIEIKYIIAGVLFVIASIGVVFKTSILSEDIDEKEIMALETRIQIGEDKKLDYNPICLYIKVDNLSAVEYNDQQIANYMNISESEVKERREIFRLMNEYLLNMNQFKIFMIIKLINSKKLIFQQ